MVRVKVTSSDIHAKLARGECANYRNNGCQGRTPCTVVNGEACQYFATYVKPLLDYPDVMAKYGREAKMTVALNPKAKVIRKRRLANEPTLAAPLTSPAPEPAAAGKQPAPAKPALIPAAPPRRTAAARATTPAAPSRTRAGKELLLIPVEKPVQQAAGKPGRKSRTPKSPPPHRRSARSNLRATPRPPPHRQRARKRYRQHRQIPALPRLPRRSVPNPLSRSARAFTRRNTGASVIAGRRRPARHTPNPPRPHPRPPPAKRNPHPNPSSRSSSATSSPPPPPPVPRGSGERE